MSINDSMFIYTSNAESKSWYTALHHVFSVGIFPGRLVGDLKLTSIDVYSKQPPHIRDPKASSPKDLSP